MKIFAETGRLIFREIVAGDEHELYALDSDTEVHRYLGNKPVQNIEQVREMIQFIRQQYIDNGIGRWGVIEKATNSFIGWAGLKLVRELTNNHINYYDVGYRFIRKYWGQGYATEAAIASVGYGFEKLQLSEMIGIADARNTASQKVLQKAGLKFIEVFDYDDVPHHWYMINRNDWLKEMEKGR